MSDHPDHNSNADNDIKLTDDSVSESPLSPDDTAPFGTESVNPDPISVYLTLRKYDPVTSLEELRPKLDEMIERGQNLVDEYALPNLLMPLREEIASGSF